MPKIYVLSDPAAPKKTAIFYSRKEAAAEKAKREKRGANCSIEPLDVDPTRFPRKRVGNIYVALDEWDGKTYVANDVEANLQMALDYAESTNKVDMERRAFALAEAYHHITDISGTLIQVLMFAAAGATGDEIVEVIKELDGWSETHERFVKSIRDNRLEAEQNGGDILVPFRDKSEEMQTTIQEYLSNRFLEMMEDGKKKMN